MAEGRDRVEFTPDDVVKLLVNMRDCQKEEQIFGIIDEKTEFLRRCLRYLDDYERDILVTTYADGVSMRKYSRHSGFSRTFIAKSRQKSVELLTKFFNIKYSI